MIGLTIVAFGTSAPELTVSVSSALKGSADIAIGNVVGSNIFNTLMIVGCTALFAPIVITRNTLRKEIPLCILSSIVLLICANDVFLDKAPENILNRVDGLLLLCFFVIFMGYTFAIASKPVTMEQQAEHPVIEEETEIKSLPWWQSILYIIGLGRPYLWRAVVCRRCHGHRPQPGCQRINYRTDTGCRRDFSSGTGYVYRCRIKEKSGNCHWKCDW